MKISGLLILLIFWIGFNISDSFAQKLSRAGSTTIRLDYENPKSDLVVTAEIFHSFPSFSHSEIIDTLSTNKPVLWLSCPVHVSQEGFVTIGDQKFHLFMIPSDTIFIKIDESKRNLGYQVGGKNKQIQNYYQAKSARFAVPIGQQIMNAGTGDLDLISFKKVADSLYVLDYTFWQSYTHKKILPVWFVRYESDAIRYQNAQLRLYVLNYRRQVGRTIENVPGDYFHFLDSLPIRKLQQFMILNT